MARSHRAFAICTIAIHEVYHGMPDQFNLYPDIPMPQIQRRNLRGEPETVVTADGDTIDADESATTEDGEIYHQDNVCSCEECNSIHHEDSDSLATAYADDGRTTPRESSIRCENCRTTCNDCRREYRDDLSSSNSCNEAICQRCAENYYSCDHCGWVIHSDDTHNRDDQMFCQSCYDAGEDEEAESESDDSRSPALIRDYSYKPTPAYFRADGETIPADLSAPPITYYGLEIECEDKSGHGQNVAIRDSGLSALPEFYVKKDGSLDNGMEVVSHPGTYAYWQSHKFAFADKLRNLGFRAYDTDTCGLHIHVSKTALSEPHLVKLLAFAAKNQDFMYFISRRKDIAKLNGYSKLKSGTIANLRAFAKGDFRSRTFAKEYEVYWREQGYTSRTMVPASVRRNWESKQRYTAINCLNRHTIEFRLFRGTLNVESIKRNLAFVAAIIAYVQQSSNRHLTVHAFAKWIAADGFKVVGRPMADRLSAWIDQHTKGQIRPETEAA